MRMGENISSKNPWKISRQVTKLLQRKSTSYLSGKLLRTSILFQESELCFQRFQEFKPINLSSSVLAVFRCFCFFRWVHRAGYAPQMTIHGKVREPKHIYRFLWNSGEPQTPPKCYKGLDALIVQNVLLTVLRMDKAAAEQPFRCFNHCFQKVTDFHMWDQILPDETLQKVSTLNFIWIITWLVLISPGDWMPGVPSWKFHHLGGGLLVPQLIKGFVLFHGSLKWAILNSYFCIDDK